MSFYALARSPSLHARRDSCIFLRTDSVRSNCPRSDLLQVAPSQHGFLTQLFTSSSRCNSLQMHHVVVGYSKAKCYTIGKSVSGGVHAVLCKGWLLGRYEVHPYVALASFSHLHAYTKRYTRRGCVLLDHKEESIIKASDGTLAGRSRSRRLRVVFQKPRGSLKPNVPTVWSSYGHVFLLSARALSHTSNSPLGRYVFLV